MATAYVAIGANLGDPLAQAQSAVTHLAALPETRVVAVSSWYRSAAIGPAQPDYINGVASITTALSPLDLLDSLQHIELAHGRQRLQHWGPRTLDLDLLLYDNLILQSERLQLPHPQLTLRNFVVIPLREVAPQLMLPDGRDLVTLTTSLGSDGLARWQQNQ
jgi:2-amino-4-hydroxy-6-hydroxymethyldihydropteridine diphosphokinase